MFIILSTMLALLSRGWKPRIFQHVIEWSIWKLERIDLWNISMGLQGRIQELLVGGVQTLVQMTVELFCDLLRKQRRPHVSQSVNTFRGWCRKYCFASRGKQIMRIPKNNYINFWIVLGFSFVAKCNLRFIKKISQLESDIWSCQCKSFSFKQASDLIGGSGPSPWIRQSVLFTLLPSRMCVM